MFLRMLLAAVFLPAVLIESGAAASAYADNLTNLTTAHAVHSLSPEEAARGIPVGIRGLATYFEKTSYFPYGEMFLVDATGGVYVTLGSSPAVPVHPGALVEVVGVTGAGGYASQVNKAQVRVVGEPGLPTVAPLVTMTQLLSGADDCKWVAIEGVVHSVEQSGDRERILVEMNGGLIAVLTPREPGADYGRLIGAYVRILGNSAPTFNHNRQLTGTFLFSPSLKQLTVLEAGPFDAFALPIEAIGGVLRFRPKTEYGQQIHIRGRVTLDWPGNKLCLEEAGHGICADIIQTTPVQVGDDVDVVGFPVVGDLTPTLSDAVFRTAGSSGALNSAPKISAKEALQGGYDSRLVEIEGTLIGRDWSEKQPIVFLSAGRFVYSATLPGGSPIQQVQSLREGSVLRVTGICSVHVDSALAMDRNGFAVPSSFRILLRSPRDLVVLRRPSWWTPSRALVVFGMIAIVVLVAFFWVVTLQRRVEQQTRVIRDSEERLRYMAQHDALTGLPNRALLYDRMQMALERAARFETKMGLLMVDLDGFKEINDSLGHDVGDSVLREAAHRLNCAVRNADTAARIGGDEFIILLPDLKSEKDIARIAAMIVAIFSAPIEVGTRAVSISASVGACTYPSGGKNIDTLLKSADLAMYQAKGCGRNRYCIFSQETSPAEICEQHSAPTLIAPSK